MVSNINEEPLRSIIENVERLIKDSHILLANGSPGSALSLAILAFEEAGKGHSFELSLEKTRRTPSWHIFRQVTSAFVLIASLYQKYGLSQPTLSARAQELLEERVNSTKTLMELAKKPVPEEYRQEVLCLAKVTLASLNPEQAEVFPYELRWVRKILQAASEGRIESERQRGMYVDLCGEIVTSTPEAVTAQDAFYWIRVAERTLRLLKHGEYAEPYGELAAFLHTLPKPPPPIEQIMEQIDRLRAAVTSNNVQDNSPP